MEGHGHIRPLSPAEPEPPRPRRPWSLLMTMAAAVIVAGILVTTFDGGTDAAPPPTTTTIASPPALSGTTPTSTTTTSTTNPSEARVPSSTLAEMVPGLGSELMRIAYLDRDTGDTATTGWAAASPRPVPVRVGITSSPGGEWPSFSPTGASFAHRRDPSGLAVGSGNRALTVAAGVTSWAWHSDRQELAWIAQVPGASERALYRATPDRFSGLVDPTDIVEVAPLPATAAALDGWGDLGYAIGFERSTTEALPIMSIVLDLDGDALFALPGRVAAVGANGALAVGMAREGDAAAIDAAFSVEVLGWDVPVLDPGSRDLVVLDPEHQLVADVSLTGERAVYLTADGSTLLTAAADTSRDEALIEIRPLPDGAVRGVTSIPDIDRVLRLSGDDRWLLMWGAGEIVFHDWAERATYRVPFELGDVIDVNLSS